MPDTVAVLWSRSGASSATIMLQSSSGAKYTWTTTTALVPGFLSQAGGYPTVSATGKGWSVPLLELLVWNQALTAGAQTDLSTYLSSQWGVGLPLVGATVTTRPDPLPSYNVRFLYNFDSWPPVNLGPAAVTSLTYGTCSQSTTVYKFGTGCLRLPGNSAVHIVPPSPIVLTGDFTIQAWVMLDSPVGDGSFLAGRHSPWCVCVCVARRPPSGTASTRACSCSPSGRRTTTATS